MAVFEHCARSVLDLPDELDARGRGCKSVLVDASADCLPKVLVLCTYHFYCCRHPQVSVVDDTIIFYWIYRLKTIAKG